MGKVTFELALKDEGSLLGTQLGEGRYKQREHHEQWHELWLCRCVCGEDHVLASNSGRASATFYNWVGVGTLTASLVSRFYNSLVCLCLWHTYNRLELSKMVAGRHLWPFTVKLIKIKLTKKNSSSDALAALWASVATSDHWLPYWTAQMWYTSIIAESSTGQHSYR